MSEWTKWNRQPQQQEQVKRKFKNEFRIKKKHEIIKESKKIKKTKEKNSEKSLKREAREKRGKLMQRRM